MIACIPSISRLAVPKELPAKPEDPQEEAASRFLQAKTEPHTYYIILHMVKYSGATGANRTELRFGRDGPFRIHVRCQKQFRLCGYWTTKSITSIALHEFDKTYEDMELCVPLYT